MAEPDFEIKMGEKVVLVYDGINSGRDTNRQGLNPKYKNATISKVGTKYFYIKCDDVRREYKFYIDTQMQVSNCCADVSVHKDWDVYLENIQLNKDFREFKEKYFDTFSGTKVTRSQLDRLISILEE